MTSRGVVVSVLAVCIAVLIRPAASRAQGDVARLARNLISGLDLADARRVLAAADPDVPSVALERARLALYEMDCDAAAVILGRPDVQKIDDGALVAEIARGCQRVTAALAFDRDEARGIEVRWQDEHDASLATLIFETVALARDKLTHDLGVDWPRPTRIVVVRDLLSLSAMTGLPYTSAKTTGTVAVAKWGRVTLLSPRASPYGYLWRDTIAHELTHLAVTRASRDRAPLWLQEGVAKNEESRWRSPGPFDDRPSADAVALRGIASGHLLPLDALGPSIAMLPSADAATVAFAEVTSFVHFFTQRQGEEALPKLLRECRDAPDASRALFQVSGADLGSWDKRWRAYVETRPADRLQAVLATDRSRAEKGDIAIQRQQRDRTRLAQLLLSRGHASSALAELDRLDALAPSLAPDARERQGHDAALRWLRGRALEQADTLADQGERLYGDPLQVLSPFGSWWASRGRWERRLGDETAAGASFVQAVANDPFGSEAACEVVEGEPPASVSRDAPRGALCGAARSWATTPLDE